MRVVSPQQSQLQPSSSEDDPKEPFELHVGRALDTLRSDYPRILTKDPNFAIYDPTIEFVDPSGVKVHGLRQYKGAFAVLHALVQFIYCPARSSVSYRLCFDKARQNIRVSWNVEVVPREIFGGLRTVAHVDGISVYELDRDSGNITQHRIEQLLFNNHPVQPKEGVIAQLRREYSVTVPSFVNTEQQQQQQQQQDDGKNTPIVVHFQLSRPDSSGKTTTSPLFALEAATSGDSSEEVAVSAATHSQSQYPGLDWEALELKNKSRKKFGLKPLSPEEFLELETQVQQLASQQRAAAAEQQQQQQKAAQEQQQSSSTTSTATSAALSFLDKMLGNVLPKDTCESNYDCERPQICCDFGFQKRCCSSGSMVFSGQMKPVLVPVPVDNPYPPGMGPNDPPRRY